MDCLYDYLLDQCKFEALMGLRFVNKRFYSLITAMATLQTVNLGDEPEPSMSSGFPLSLQGWCLKGYLCGRWKTVAIPRFENVGYVYTIEEITIHVLDATTIRCDYIMTTGDRYCKYFYDHPMKVNELSISRFLYEVSDIPMIIEHSIHDDAITTSMLVYGSTMYDSSWDGKCWKTEYFQSRDTIAYLWIDDDLLVCHHTGDRTLRIYHSGEPVYSYEDTTQTIHKSPRSVQNLDALRPYLTLAMSNANLPRFWELYTGTVLPLL